MPYVPNNYFEYLLFFFIHSLGGDTCLTTEIAVMGLFMKECSEFFSGYDRIRLYWVLRRVRTILIMLLF